MRNPLFELRLSQGKQWTIQYASKKQYDTNQKHMILYLQFLYILF